MLFSLNIWILSKKKKKKGEENKRKRKILFYPYFKVFSKAPAGGIGREKMLKF